MCGWIRERGDEPFAIGEVGLPYYTRKEAEERGEPFDLGPYRRQLERFVTLAAELDRPIALHSVYEDADETIELLERYRVRRAHFHWFKGSPESVARMVDNGYFISVTPDVEYEKEIRELATVYPLDRLMVETDGPWPFEGSFAGKETEPGMVRAVIREIAALRGLREDQVDAVVRRNTELLYRWDLLQP
ncbi:TatD family hydrolase [Cohnella faecalis]|uniref:TatD family hydrolase n=1 Tax=Cohnella faecalis TaxID=2315694 RepID=UPI001F3EA11B|nr:TatD family hydrolase [Cohnella faecalis]